MNSANAGASAARASSRLAVFINSRARLVAARSLHELRSLAHPNLDCAPEASLGFDGAVGTQQNRLAADPVNFDFEQAMVLLLDPLRNLVERSQAFVRPFHRKINFRQHDE